jgi:Acyl-CoA reductase (LuxC)
MDTTHELLPVPHVIRGRSVVPTSPDEGTAYNGFFTPRIDLDELVWMRDQPGPAFDLPVAEIIDFLVEFGKRLDPEHNRHMAEAFDRMVQVNPLGPRILGAAYRSLSGVVDRASLEFQVDQEVGRDRLDGWAAVSGPDGRTRNVRAFPPRLIHVLAGNTPGVTAITIARAALTKGVHLLKLPSNDLFTASAMLRTMEDLDPEHPVTRSFSCAYWRGGDTKTESALFRSQYFDKLVAWGGDAAIRNALSYIGPGFELVSFDPKVSISVVGREAFADQVAMKDSAAAAATDVALFNQSACASSRFIFVEAPDGESPDNSPLGEWCQLLASELGVDRPMSDGAGVPVPPDVKDEIGMLRGLEPMYQVWGDLEHGTVILSEDPVDFHPEGKTVNVIPIAALADVLPHVNVATQTIGIYPKSRSAELRDALAARGMQRLVPLGHVLDHIPGLPHDGFFPLHRFMRWLVDDC